MFRIKILAFILFLGLAFCPAFVFADFKLLDSIEEFGEKRTLKPLPTRIKLGPVKFHPTLRSKVTYDDNILLEPQDAREDIIFNIMPGAILELPIDKHQLAVGYEADIEVFAKSRDAKQNDQNQSFFALADIHFPSWYINILEKFAETSGRSGTTFTERIPRFDQSINPKVGYRWKRAIFEAGFRHFARDFRRQIDDPFDFQLVEWNGVLYYDLFARLKALLEYQFAQIDYDDSKDRNANISQVRMGLEGEVLPNVTVKAKTGLQFRNYDTSSKPDFNSWVAKLDVIYQMRENLRWTLAFSREPVEATFGDINYYKEYTLSFGMEYKILPQWILFSTFRYLHHDYAERSTLDSRTGYRRDDHYQVTSGLRYLFRDWLEFEAAYDFLRRDSNFSLFDYTDNRFSFTTSFIY